MRRNLGEEVPLESGTEVPRATGSGSWEDEQRRLVGERHVIEDNIGQRLYEAGKVRGSRGDYEAPPWMSHLHELFPKVPQTSVETIQAAHAYGRTEGYVEHAHDLISDEFTPRANAIASQADRARAQMGNADTQLLSAGIRAVAGGRRTTTAGVSRRSRQAHARFGEAQAAADNLQTELSGRLNEIEGMRKSLDDSPWKPRH